MTLKIKVLKSGVWSDSHPYLFRNRDLERNITRINFATLQFIVLSAVASIAAMFDSE